MSLKFASGFGMMPIDSFSQCKCKFMLLSKKNKVDPRKNK